MNDEQDREEHMSKIEAVGIMLKLAYKRTTTRDEVIAIQVVCRSTLKRFFDRERNWKRRHDAEIAAETAEAIETTETVEEVRERPSSARSSPSSSAQWASAQSSSASQSQPGGR